MIIVLVKYTCKPNRRQAFLDAIRENRIDELSRSEAGNHKYEYSFSTTDPDTLILNEIWEDMEAVNCHGEMAHFKKLGEMKAEYVDHTEIQRYEAALL